MKIKLLDIKGFGKFSQLRIEPNEGFNIVFENNESGKSTLQAFIRAMLYGQKGGRKSKDGSLPPQKHFKPWNSEQYAGILEYTLENGKSYRVGRNFEKGTTNIYDDGANNITSNFSQSKDVGPEFAEEHLGIDEAAFERSAFISQLQSVINEEGKKNLIEKLSNLNTTGSEELSLSVAVNAIETALLERVGTKTSSTRPLNKVNDKLSELDKERLDLEELNERYLETFSSLKEQTSLLNNLDEELEKLNVKKEARKAKEILKLKEELEGLIEENKRKDESLKECNRSIIKLKAFENIDEISISEQMMSLYEEKRLRESIIVEQERLQEVSDKREELEDVIDPEELFDKKIEDVTTAMEIYNEVKNSSKKAGSGKQRYPYQEVKQNKAVKRNWLTFIIPAGLLSSMLLMGNYFYKHELLFLLLGIFIAIVIGSIYLISESKKHRLAKKALDASEELNRVLAESGFADMVDFVKYRETQINNREKLSGYSRQIVNIKEHIENLSSKIEEIDVKWNLFIEKCGLSEYGLERSAFLEYLKQGLGNLKNTKEQKKMLLAEKENINDKCEIVLRQAGMLVGEVFLTSAELEGYVKNLNPAKEQDDGLPGAKLDEVIKLVEGRIKEAQLKIAALKARLEDVPAESELSRVIEEISQYKEKKEALEMKGSALSLASQILKEVALDMQKNYIPELNKEMSRIMDLVTLGRYKKISTNDELKINLEVPETEELMPVSRLSGGTIDQVYLSMRLAAVSLMDREREKLPLFLDEPFSQYDEERVKNAFELLKDISKERQIFFFTCREREYELACAAFGEALNRIRL